MGEYLNTDRIILREFRLSDEEELFLLDSDPEVMRYITLGRTTPREDIIPLIKRVEFLKQKFSGRLGVWIAETKEKKEFMGWFHFRPDRKDLQNTKRIELGYRLKKNFWGQGFATEVSLALIKKGFTELSVDEVFAITLKDNLASQAVMKKVGMRFVREFDYEHNPGSTSLALEYALKKENYDKAL
jgi:RimJ/RimL family protein N-acetyltransferase